MQDRILHDPTGDGIDRRGFLRCMAWASTGLVWTVSAGILGCQQVGPDPAQAKGKKSTEPHPDEPVAPAAGDFTFVQLSDSHIGFNRAPNTDVAATLRAAIAQINALPQQPALLLHTGDLTHLARAGEFDTVAQLLGTARAGELFCVPGEHDVFTDDGRLYRERFGRGSRGDGWRSFDYRGVHFIGLVNVRNLQAGHLGSLGQEQLDWLRQDLAGRGSSTPIVVFAHVPLWSVYPQWGWGTEDAAQALALLRPFGSVTVLNGHVHQILQRIEGNVTFHTARSTAFPQPAPGAAPSPGPLRNVAADRLRGMLGVTRIRYVETGRSLAVTDTALS